MRQEPTSLTSRVGIANGGGLTSGLSMVPAHKSTLTPQRVERQVVPRTAAQRTTTPPAEPEPTGEVEDIVETYRKRRKLKDEDARWIRTQLSNFGRLKTEDTAREVGLRSGRYMKLAKALGEEAQAGNLDRQVAQVLIRRLTMRMTSEKQAAANRAANAQLNPLERFAINAQIGAEDIGSENISPSLYGSQQAAKTAEEGGQPLSEVVPPEAQQGIAASAGKFLGRVLPSAAEQLLFIGAPTAAATTLATPAAGLATAGATSTAYAAGTQVARRRAQQKFVDNAQREFDAARKAFKKDPKNASTQARMRAAIDNLERSLGGVTPVLQQARQALANVVMNVVAPGISGATGKVAGAVTRAAPRLVSSVPTAVRAGVPLAADVAGALGSTAASSAIAEGRLPTKEELAVAGLFSAPFIIGGARKHAATVRRSQQGRAGELEAEASFLDSMLQSNSVEPNDIPKVQKELERTRKELDRLNRRMAPSPRAQAAPAPAAAPAAEPAEPTKPAAKGKPAAGPRTWTGEQLVKKEAPVEVGDTVVLPNQDGTTTTYTVAAHDPNKTDITVVRADAPDEPAILLETGKGYESPLALHNQARKNPLPSKPITDQKVEGLGDIIGEGRAPEVGKAIQVRLANGATRKVRVTQDLGEGVLEVDDGLGNKFRLNTRANDPAALTPADFEPIAPEVQPSAAGAPAVQGRIEPPTKADEGSYYMLKPKMGKDGKPTSVQLIVVESVDEANGTFTYRYGNEAPGAKLRTANLADLGKMNEAFIPYVGTEPSVRAAYDAAQTVEDKIKAARAVIDNLNEARQAPMLAISDAQSKGRGAPFFEAGELNALDAQEKAFVDSLPDEVRSQVLQQKSADLRGAVDTQDALEFAKSYDPKTYLNADADTQSAAIGKYQEGVQALIAELKQRIESDPQWKAAPEGAFKVGRAKEITADFLKGLNNNNLAADIRATMGKAAKTAKEPKAAGAPKGRPAAIAPAEGVVVIPSGNRALRYRVESETDGELVLTRLNNQNEPDPAYTNVRVPKGSGLGARVLQAQGREVPKAPAAPKEPPAPKAPKGAGEIPVRPNKAALDQQFGDLSPEMRNDFRSGYDGDEQALKRIEDAGMKSRFDTYQAWLDKSDALAASEMKARTVPTAPKEAAEPPEAGQLRELLAKFGAAKTPEEVDDLSDLADEFVQGLSENQRKEAKQAVYAAADEASTRLADAEAAAPAPETPKGPSKGTVAGAVAAGLGTLATAAPAKAAVLAVTPSLVQTLPDLVGHITTNLGAGFAGLASATIAVGGVLAAKRAGSFAQFLREFTKQPEIAQYLKGMKTQAEQRAFLASTRTMFENVAARAADFTRNVVGGARATERYFLRSMGEEFADARGLRGKERDDFMAYYNNGLLGALKEVKKEKLEPAVRKVATSINDTLLADTREPGAIGREVLALLTGDAAIAPEMKKIRNAAGMARKIEDQTIAKYGQDLDDRFRKWFFEKTTAERERIWRFFTTAPESMTPVERQQFADLLEDGNLTAMRNAIKDSADELARQGLLSEGAKQAYAGRFLQTRYQADTSGKLRNLIDSLQNLGGRGKAQIGRQKGEYRGVSNEDINTPFDSAEARDEWITERNKNWSIESVYDINGEPHYTLVTQRGERVENVNDLPNWNIEGRPKWRAINDPRSGNPFKANRDVTEPELAAKQFVADGPRDIIHTLRSASRDKERGAIAEAVAANPELAVSDRTSDDLQRSWGQQRYGRSDDLGVYRIEGETPDGKIRVQPLDDRKPAVELEPNKVKELGRNENTQEFLSGTGFAPAVKLGNQRWDVLDVKKIKGKLVYTLRRGSEIRENVPQDAVRPFRLLSVPPEVRANGVGAFRPKEMNFGKLNDTFVDPDVYGLMQALSYPSRIAEVVNGSLGAATRLWKLGIIGLNPLSLGSQFGQNLFAFQQLGGSMFQLPEGIKKFGNRELVNDLDKSGLFVDLGSQEAAGIEGAARTSTEFRSFKPSELYNAEVAKYLDAIRESGREPSIADVVKATVKAAGTQGYKGVTRALPAAIQWQDALFRFMIQQNFEHDLIYNRGMAPGDARKLAVEMALDSSYRSNPNPIASILSKTVAPFASVWGYTTFTQPQLAFTNPVGYLINKATTGFAGWALGQTDENEPRVVTRKGEEQTLSIAQIREMLKQRLDNTTGTVAGREFSYTGVPSRMRVGQYDIPTGRYDPGKGKVSIFPELGGPLVNFVQAGWSALQAAGGSGEKLREAVREFSMQNEKYTIPAGATTPTSEEVDNAVSSLAKAFLPIVGRIGAVIEPGAKQDFNRGIAALQLFVPIARYKPESIGSRIKAWERDEYIKISKRENAALRDIEETPENRARISQINAKFEAEKKIIKATGEHMKRLASELVRAERERTGKTLVAPAK